MEPSIWQPWSLEATAALALPVLILVAVLFGEWAARARVPRLIGYTVAGVGCAALAFLLRRLEVPLVSPAQVEFAVAVATSVILFDLGSRASWGWLRRNPALLATSVVEAGLSFLVLLFVLRLAGVGALPAALIAAVGMATSPAVVLSVTRELRGQGQVTERTLLLTALNCAYAVVISHLLMAWAHVEARGVFDALVLQPLYTVFGSVVIAVLAARGLLPVLRIVGRDRATQIIVLLVSIALVFVLAYEVRLSPPLALLTFGACARAFDDERRLLNAELALPSAIALVLFFTLSLAAVDLAALTPAWLPALAVAIWRAGAKIAGTLVLARASGLTWRKGVWVGLGLTPMSALSLLMSRDIGSVYPQLAAQLASVVVASALLLQVVGALALAWALRRSGEAREEP
jgi:Kef-type K+ transport system membrane component KefB